MTADPSAALPASASIATAVAALLRNDTERVLGVADTLRGPDRMVQSTVSGFSMGESLPPGTQIRIDLGPRRRYDVGEVVAAQIGGQCIVHRVVAHGQGPRGGEQLITRGDASLVPDPPFHERLVLGVVSGMLVDDRWSDIPAPLPRRRRGRVASSALTTSVTTTLMVSPRSATVLANAMHRLEWSFRRFQLAARERRSTR